MKTIRFKSTPENYRKEYLGLKCNTVRKEKEKGDIRFEILNDFINFDLHELCIEIMCSDNYEIFIRKVTDITKFDDYYIISWN